MANRNRLMPRLLPGEDGRLDGSDPMNWKRAILVAALILCIPLTLPAQTASSSQSSTAAQPQEGEVWGDFAVHQTIEVGGRIVGINGNQQMYATFVNLYGGPRLLETDLSMQSLNNQGLLFDRLDLTSFGFGGDPESVLRLRLEKNHWYNFSSSYRRDKNYFNYDLFANPLNLNAGITTCGAGCTNAFSPTAQFWYSNSPHMQATTRNMGDFNLTLFPESKVSVRLGWARNATYGLQDTSLEAPIRGVLTQDWQWRSDRYQFGADIKALPRTNISLDVFFEHDKNDIGYVDQDALYNLGNALGPQVDIGILLPPLSGTLPSCFNGQTIRPGNLFIINAGCNSVLVNSGPGGGYYRHGNVRTDIPTGQLSIQSNYIRKLTFTANGTYSSADSDFLNFQEFMHGSTATLNSGTPNAGRISANADLGLIYQISDHWQASDTFRWLNWREPGNFLNTAFNCVPPTGAALAGPVGFPAGAVTLTPLRGPCNSSILALTGLTAVGNAPASSSYQVLTNYDTLLGAQTYTNTTKLSWRPGQRFGAYVGFRYDRRQLNEGANGTGIVDQTTSTFSNTGTGAVPTVPTIAIVSAATEGDRINAFTGLGGVVIRPTKAWRTNADVELLSADNAFTNITPRHQQRVRVYTNFKVRSWLGINGGVHLVQTRNPFAAGQLIEPNTGITGAVGSPLFPASFIPTAYGHKDHWYYYTAGFSLNPNSRTALDLGWTMLDQNINSATCMPITGTGGVFVGTFPAITSPPESCNNAAAARALLLDYQETTHTGYTNLNYQATRRLTLSLGYEITSDNGFTNWLRADNGLPLMVVGDIYGNSPPLAGNPITPCPGASVATGCVFAGPFPDQPLGPQAINWHKAHAGLAYELGKGLTFKGFWGYYDYNAKDQPPSLSLLNVVAPRDFHANTGTLSLRYSF